MRTVKYKEAMRCFPEYYGCFNTTCPLYTFFVRKKSFFAIDDWPYSECPFVRKVIGDDTLDDNKRSFFEAYLFTRKFRESLPIEIRNKLKRCTAKVPIQDMFMNIIINIFKGKPMFFNNRI